MTSTSTRVRGALLLAAPWLVLGIAAACSSDAAPDGSCASDADCTAPGTRCGLEIGQCICVTDEACDDGFFCNGAGVCQEQSGCVRNSDCDEGSFCDVKSGQCLEGSPLTETSLCGLSSHCPLGSICQGGRCTPGCYDSGDCPVSEVCQSGQCIGGFGICAADRDCEYGQACDLPSNQCEDDRRGPYCRACTQRTLGNPEPCDDPRNFCLINNRELGGFTQFCGVDCSLGQACPNGYTCSGVVILTQDSCTNNAQCQCGGALRFATATCTVAAACDPRLPDGRPDPARPPCVYEGEPACNGGVEGGAASCIVQAGNTVGNCTCGTDDDCSGGATCTAGLCCSGSVRADRECRGGEGTTSGFCSCSTDDDCPNNSCDGSRGACSLTGDPCTPGNNDCGPVPCVDGGCVIGQNCAPEQGLACSDVLGR